MAYTVDISIQELSGSKAHTRNAAHTKNIKQIKMEVVVHPHLQTIVQTTEQVFSHPRTNQTLGPEKKSNTKAADQLITFKLCFDFFFFSFHEMDGLCEVSVLFFCRLRKITSEMSDSAKSAIILTINKHIYLNIPKKHN